MYIKKQRLLAPGPTPLYPPAVHAMMGSDIHHRTAGFQAVYDRVLTDLKAVFGTTQDVLPLVTSGTGAMEAAVTNCFSPGDRVIVATAGKFGERWAEIAKAYALAITLVERPYGEPLPAEAVAEALHAHPDAKGVLMQAAETSTGVEHPVREIAAAVRPTQAILVIDAITGLGTMRLDIEGWGLDVIIGGSQKSFMIPPGLAFVSLSGKAWDASSRARLPRFYFDFIRERKAAHSGEPSWTPAVSLILALGEALRYIQTLGMGQLIENARLLAAATRASMQALGLELFAKSSPSAAVTSVRAPRGLDSGAIIQEFHNRFAATITNGQGSMKGQIFRLAHLGYYDFPELFATIAALELILAARGIPVDFGGGVAAAQAVYASAAGIRTA
ncbi:MAG: alanine--glyoxylate aminotransferase family protein [Bryobacteraceae bacterium]|nr:alanine--glyoxylate aminotransferase family protein [Bryobacteraceae bacterium]